MKSNSWSALRDEDVLQGCYGAYIPAEHPWIHLHLSARSSCATSCLKICLEHISDNSTLYPFVSDCLEVHIADASCLDVKELAG